MSDKVTANETLDALEHEAGDGAATLEVRDQRFALVKEVPAIVMLRLSAAGDPSVTPSKQMSAIVTFLEKVVTPEDRDAFMAYLENAEPVIDFDELSTILERATEVLAGRPT
jgi:hypothetical protein